MNKVSSVGERTSHRLGRKCLDKVSSSGGELLLVVMEDEGLV